MTNVLHAPTYSGEDRAGRFRATERDNDSVLCPVASRTFSNMEPPRPALLGDEDMELRDRTALHFIARFRMVTRPQFKCQWTDRCHFRDLPSKMSRHVRSHTRPGTMVELDHIHLAEITNRHVSPS